MRWISFVILISCQIIAFTASSELTPPGYAIASAHPLATNAGLEILAKGGNAFDAMVAVGASLAVVEPYHSGLGGGGFWLLYDAKTKKNIVIDGREMAPLSATKDMFLDKNGKRNPLLSLNGGLAAAIPGEPAALVYIAEHYGKLPLKESLKPAIRLAEEGFPVDAHFVYFLEMCKRLKLLQQYPASAKIFLHQGRSWQIGEILKQPELGSTLRAIANKGRQAFYEGEIAEKLVRGVNEAGGHWTLQDLQDYELKIREPLQGAFGDMLIITVPPPSAGGVELLTMLNIIYYLPSRHLTKVQWVHYLVEAMRLAYWQANKTLADPDFIPIALEKLISAENAKKLSKYIRANAATPSAELTKSNFFKESEQTTHVAILDQEGNRVSATMTINYIFGSGVVAPGTGVLLNDEMDDFSTKLGERNVFGIVGSQLNVIEPRKRPLSSMAPVFLQMPDRLAIAGTPGGSRIPSMMLLSSLVFKNYGGAISMVSAMRFHHQYLPDWIQFEPDSFSPKLQQQLKKMGYKLMALKQYYGDMQAITWDKRTNLITAASDPRNIGSAVVISHQPSGYGFKN